MDLQTRKLNAIGYLINLQDEKIFSKIESTIIEIQQKDKRKFKPFTQKQLVERAKLSEKDYLSEKVKTQEQIEIESENW